MEHIENKLPIDMYLLKYWLIFHLKMCVGCIEQV